MLEDDDATITSYESDFAEAVFVSAGSSSSSAAAHRLEEEEADLVGNLNVAQSQPSIGQHEEPGKSQSTTIVESHDAAKSLDTATMVVPDGKATIVESHDTTLKLESHDAAAMVGSCDDSDQVEVEEVELAYQVLFHQTEVSQKNEEMDGSLISDKKVVDQAVLDDIETLRMHARQHEDSLEQLLHDAKRRSMRKQVHEERKARILQKWKDFAQSLKRFEEALENIKVFVQKFPEYAIHVVIALQYATHFVSPVKTELKSSSMIQCDLYKAHYDGVRMEDLIRHLSNQGLSWRIDGDFALLRSRIQGVNEVLEMIAQRHTIPHDSIIIKIAMGEVQNIDAKVVDDLFDVEKGKKNVEAFVQTLMVANASVGNMFHNATPTKVSRFSKLVSGAVYYGCCYPSRGRHMGEVSYTGDSQQIMDKLPFAQYMWNLPDRKLVKTFYRLGLPSIRHSTGFAINEKLKARFICDHDVGVLPKGFGDSRKREKAKQQKALVLHFHGGGFISMSAFSHENYTRFWAKQCKVPIISVDYSLAPEHAFPTALNEAFAAYQWCVEKASTVYKCNKVILTGDSAGGTLCAALTIKCINEGYRVPDGLLLVYPAVDISRNFTPSMLFSLNDKMIPYMFLQCCMSAYLGTTDINEMLKATGNPLVSPNSASDEVLVKFPPCHLIATTGDPLYDGSIIFGERLRKLLPLGHVKLSIVPGMIHGFLSLNWPVVGVPEVTKLIHYVGKDLQDLIDK